MSNVIVRRGFGQSDSDPNHAHEERGYDGILCGHIHHGEIKYIDNVIYMHTSDWVETRGAIVELNDGQLDYCRN
jgi:UDP-2,3-diacylglucosamine pyrophosphatase LpxH